MTTLTEQIIGIINASDHDDSSLWAGYDRLYETQTVAERAAFGRLMWGTFGKPNMPCDIIVGSDAAQDELVGMVTAVFLAGFVIGREHCQQELPTP